MSLYKYCHKIDDHEVEVDELRRKNLIQEKKIEQLE